MSQRLAGKVAVITGGSSGIGLATAKRFVDEGAYVFITGRRKSELDAAVKEIGHDVTGVQGDASKLADIDTLYAAVKEQKGKLDIVFANAGTGEFAPLGQITEEHFDKQFNVNVKGLLFTVQKALPLLQPGGCDRAECIDCCDQRKSSVQCLQRDQSRGAFICAHLVCGLERPQDTSECDQPWGCANSGLQHLARNDARASRPICARLDQRHTPGPSRYHR